MTPPLAASVDLYINIYTFKELLQHRGVCILCQEGLTHFFYSIFCWTWEIYTDLTLSKCKNIHFITPNITHFIHHHIHISKNHLGTQKPHWTCREGCPLHTLSYLHTLECPWLGWYLKWENEAVGVWVRTGPWEADLQSLWIEVVF